TDRNHASMSDMHQQDRPRDAEQIGPGIEDPIDRIHLGESAVSFLHHVVGIKVRGQAPATQAGAESRLVGQDVLCDPQRSIITEWLHGQ
ncbi:hypothetical protein WG907_16830, partial [Sphingobium sp. AN558]|uniref:hypothetical protein n=1 Tax=Sphingobium sp. AN558 TaxID=3133442 RepID=UPI0030BF8F6C